MVAITHCKDESYYGGAMPLDDLLEEVKRVKSHGKGAKLLSDEGQGKSYKVSDKKNNLVNSSKSLVAYGLGSKYGDIYFTKREAECMVLLLRGKTICGVAHKLSLSPRTVEYYIKNMKTKIGCRTKFELVDLVHASEFLQNVDF